MIKVKRTIIVFFVILNIISILFPTEVFACYYTDGTKSQEELDRDVSYWWQGHVPNDNSLITGKSGSDTIGAGACSHFSMAYALVKMGILNPANGDTPITHIQNARDKNAFLTTWGYFDFSRVDEVYPGVTYEGRDNNVSGLNAKDGLAYVKGKMSEGYYVVAIVYGSMTQGHCIFFDGINEDGTTSIGDSAYYGITWEETYGKSDSGTCFSYLELLKCEGKDFNSMPSIYDENALRGVTSADVVAYKDVVKQWNLVGMPQKSNLQSGVVIPDVGNRNSLTQAELNNIQAIKDTKDADKLSLFEVVKTVISFLGFALIVYAVLLFLAYIFDRVNSFLNISLVSMLTLGHIKVAQRDDMSELDDEMKKKKGYVTMAKLFIIIAIIVILGSLMVSGYLSYLIYSIMQTARGVGVE